MKHLRIAILAFAAMFVAVTVSSSNQGADAKKRKRVDPHIGTYQGTAEEGGTVGYTITPGAQVINFRVTGILHCRLIGSSSTYDKGPATITAPGPIPMQLRSALNPIGKQFLYEGPGGEPSGTVHIDGKLGDTPTAMKGNAFLTTGNQLGPIGSEYCTTAYSDWSADKISGPKKKRKK